MKTYEVTIVETTVYRIHADTEDDATAAVTSMDDNAVVWSHCDITDCVEVKTKRAKVRK